MDTTYPAYGAPTRPMNDTYPYPPTTSNFNSESTFNTKVDDRQISRTPSPTPSEQKELDSQGILNWKSLLNWRFWIRREWAWYYPLFIVIMVITALITIYHKQIVNWLHPVASWLHDKKVGFLVPIGVLFVISFPPLFGHEIVAVLCGLVWGLWIGFAIVAAGTFIGEVGNFYAFKYCCRARGEKLERTSIFYACLSKVVRDGGFKIALIARLSAIPGHFTTAIFSTCGMGIITFSIAAILSMPKQFITVYLGVILEDSSTGTEDPKSKIISDVVLAITILITVVAMWYIFHQIKLVKPGVIYARRKARQAKLARADFSPYSNANISSDSSLAFNPRASESDIPLTGNLNPEVSQYQQWDKNGRAVGYAGDPRLNVYAPQPLRTGGRMPSYRTENGGGYDSSGIRYPRDPEEGSRYGAGGLPPARQSTDEVGWDMRAAAGSRGEPSYKPVSPHIPGTMQRDSFSSDETIHEVANAPSPRPPPLNASPHVQPQPYAVQTSHTPTQSQYVTTSWQPPAPSGSLSSGPLPTPPYPISPFDDPPVQSQTAIGSYHGAEPTDSSYHTASSSHSRTPSPGAGANSSLPRALSPPPSGYRPNLR